MTTQEEWRQRLIAACQANDRNGVWTDADCRAEDMPISTVGDLTAIIRQWISQVAELTTVAEFVDYFDYHHEETERDDK